MFQLKKYQQFAALVVGGILSIAGVQNVSNPPLSLTGAPGEGTCVNCHLGSLNSGTGSVSMALINSAAEPVTQLEPDRTYVVWIFANQEFTRKFGFQLTAVDEKGARVGTFVADEEAYQIREGSVGGQMRQYVNHIPASTSVEVQDNQNWLVGWKAPSKLPARVKFYVSVNAANSNNQPTGDFIYTDSVSVNGDLTSRLSARQLTNFSCAPNPSNGHVKVQFAANATGTTEVQVMNTAGIMMFNQSYTASQVGNTFAQTLDIDYLPAGIYTLVINHGGQSYSERLVIY
jgi:hypothetical protein